MTDFPPIPGPGYYWAKVWDKEFPNFARRDDGVSVADQPWSVVEVSEDVNRERKVWYPGCEESMVVAQWGPKLDPPPRDRLLANALSEVDDQICKLPGIDVAIKTLRYVRAALEGGTAGVKPLDPAMAHLLNLVHGGEFAAWLRRDNPEMPFAAARELEEAAELVGAHLARRKEGASP